MKNMTSCLLAIFVMAVAPVASAVIINIPGDYPTIQEGIDAAQNGDTVLVQPGTYVENINFNGHNIVLGSLFLTTGDTSYISTTIIDGDSSGTVVTFESSEDSTAVVTGFSMQNGRAYYGAGGIYISGSSPIVRNNTISGNSTDYGGAGGIYCTNSNPAIINNTISGNSAYYGGNGGGIYCGSNSNATVTGNVISGNSAFSGHHEDGGDGGGISCYNSDPTIIGNILTRNSAVSGGGIHCIGSNPEILGNTVINNFGSAISCISSSPTLTNNILWKNSRSEIYADESSFPAFTYCDIWGGWEGEGNIDIDPLFLDPLNGNYNVCSQSPCIDAGDPDMQDPDGTRADIGLFFPEHPECFNGNVWNVSVAGNDTTGDGSPENPFRTIQYGIDTSLHGDTVLVQNGTYIESINLTVKKIVLASNYIYSGDPLDIQNTTVDGNSSYRTLRLWLCDSTVVITGLTFRNAEGSGIICYYSDATIVNNIITGNSAYSGGGISCGWFSKPRITNNIISGNSATSGGGIFCYNSGPVIENNIISENSADFGGGIRCYTSSYPTIRNNIIHDNSAEYGGGIYCYGSSPLILNNTISENSAEIGGGGIYSSRSSPVITNTIFWDDSSQNGPEIYINRGSPVFSYCDIQGGWEGEGNIDIDPLFRDPENGDFHLMSTECGDPYDSPCIDAGDPSIEDIWLDCEWGLGTSLSDMGAYGGGDSTLVGIDDDKEPEVPIRFGLSQNYPNPFNASTIIQYSLSEASDVIIQIYDILGRKVETLVQEKQPAGYHQVVWDGKDKNDRMVSTGIYFYELYVDDYRESKAMIMIK